VLSVSTVGIKISPELCTGCELCELVCSTYHFGKSSIGLSRVIVFKDHAGAKFTPMLCISCPGIPCVRACPTGALVVDEVTKRPRVIVEKCTSCGDCAKACPYNAIRFENYVLAYPLICDLCGGDPQCVKVCWPRALVTTSDLREVYTSAAKAKGLIEEIARKYRR
jgi:Fe-S-cluster-containing hydrogenase component 2